MNIEQMFDAIRKANANTRSGYHMTIGALLDLLRANPDAVVQWEDGKGADYIDSYRGYYEDCAIGDADTPQGASGLIERIEHLKAEGMTGYKGGDYSVTNRTPLWRSGYGEASSVAVIGAEVRDGLIVLLTKFIDD